MATARTESISSWDAREDTSTYPTSIGQGLSQPSSFQASFDASATTTEQQQHHPSFTTVKSELLPGMLATSNTTWHSGPLVAVHGLSEDPLAIAADNEFSAHMSHSVAAVSYPTSSQSMALKSSIVSAPLGLGYSSEPAAYTPAADMSAGMPSSVSLATMPVTSTYFEFGTAMTAETTPAATNNISMQSSPLSQHNGPLGHSMDGTPKLEPGLSVPVATRQPYFEPPRTSLSHPDLPLGLVIDTKPLLSHSKSTNFALPCRDMEFAADGNCRVSISDQPSYGLATQQPRSANSRPENSMLFPVMLYRICSNPELDEIARWDENNFVCIQSMETLRIHLNSEGMTANHADSLQKNFNDYQFKRQTDQRRIRHTTEQGIVKFSNDNFLPGREDLLPLVVRKSALKKLQGGGSQRERPSTSSSSRKKTRVPSIRASGPRMARQSTSERVNHPYARHSHGDSGQLPGTFQLHSASIGPFSPHSTSASANHMHAMYPSGEPSPVLMMPLGVSPLGLNLASSIPVSARAEPGLMSQGTTPYSQHQHSFYMDHASPSFMVPVAPPPQSSLTPVQHQYAPASFTPSSSYQRHPNLQQSPSYHPQTIVHPSYTDSYGAGNYPQLHQHGQTLQFQQPGQPMQHSQSISQHQYHMFATPTELPREQPLRDTNSSGSLM
ncbi:hypothetical protein H4R26_000051 [Coemansia thaxteri]|uniref:HSF-type DNA-binding domain-containing protein n=1 Tax=Coemansia thaxteri TaxID=2663907 RepID=A0A9W8BJ65_9FUNG|nr:hypothetical protein H4R26_000051 [Coemansia thaxteri]